MTLLVNQCIIFLIFAGLLVCFLDKKRKAESGSKNGLTEISMVSLAKNDILFANFAVFLLCFMDIINGVLFKVGEKAEKGSKNGPYGYNYRTFTTTHTIYNVDGKKFFECGPSIKISDNLTTPFESMSDFLDDVDPELGTRGRRFQLGNLCSNCSKGILLIMNKNGDVPVANFFNVFLDKEFVVNVENGTFRFLENLLGCTKDHKSRNYMLKNNLYINYYQFFNKVPPDSYLEDIYWTVLRLDIVIKYPFLFDLYPICEYLLPSERRPSEKRTTNKAPTYSTTDWPRSDQLTEEQKKQKLKECLRNIYSFNQEHPYDQRPFDEEHCLMNFEEFMEKHPC